MDSKDAKDRKDAKDGTGSMTVASGPSVSRFRAYLELIRLPNLFTAIADVMMGYLFTRTPGVPGEAIRVSAHELVILVIASCLLYSAGMVLNDVFDVTKDAHERPHRPIPSGRISLRLARRLGLALLVGGIAVGWGLSLSLGDFRPALVATLLAASVVLYDGLLKSTVVGPLAMGACRLLNVLLGMSLSPQAWQGANWLVATAIGVYVVGLTLFARTEARHSGRPQLALGTLILLLGMGLLAWLPDWQDIVVRTDGWHLFWIILALLIGWRFARAVFTPTPDLVQTAVTHGIQSIIVLDAAICFAVQGVWWGVVLLVLILPTVWLGRWVYST